MEEIKRFEVGELITIASGEYSDYCVNGLFRIIVEFDAQEQLKRWAEATDRKMDADGDVRYEWGVDRDKITFLAWLSQEGFIDDVPYRELHVGDETHGDTCLTSRGGSND